MSSARMPYGFMSTSSDLENEGDEIVLNIDHSQDEPGGGTPMAQVVEFKLFSLADLVAATHNFDPSNLLGRGSNGEVFQGSIDGRMIAVKRLPQAAWRVREEEELFKKEIRSIAAVSHKNILQLLGFCLEGDTPLLVCPKLYSLEKALADDVVILSWDIRYRIAMGIARGLVYLHHETRTPMIHCDIKPANILLDQTTFQPCIADFGLVHLVAHEETVDASTLYGTPGLMAPEIRSQKRFSAKADVYSFGKLLYALISGNNDVRQLSDTLLSKQRMFAAFGRKRRSVKGVFTALWMAATSIPRARVVPHTMPSLFSFLVVLCGTRLNDVDARVRKSVAASGRGVLQAYKASDLVAMCTQEDPRLRPDMEHAVKALESADVCSIPISLKIVTKLGSVGQKVFTVLYFLVLCLLIAAGVTSTISVYHPSYDVSPYGDAYSYYQRVSGNISGNASAQDVPASDVNDTFSSTEDYFNWSEPTCNHTYQYALVTVSDPPTYIKINGVDYVYTNLTNYMNFDVITSQWLLIRNTQVVTALWFGIIFIICLYILTLIRIIWTNLGLLSYPRKIISLSARPT